MGKYRLSDSRFEQFLAQKYGEDVSAIAYKATVLADAIDAAEEVVDIIEDIAFAIDPDASIERDDSEDDDSNENDSEDDDNKRSFEYFRDYIEELRIALPSLSDYSTNNEGQNLLSLETSQNYSGFFETKYKFQLIDQEFDWGEVKLGRVLVKVKEKLRSVRNEYSDSLWQLGGANNSTATTEFHDLDAVLVETLFEAEVKIATARLREAEKPSDGYANCVPEIAQSAMERALSVALSEWADPNQRCGAITIALALIVCPEQVRLQKPRNATAFKAGHIVAIYESVQLLLSKVGVKAREWFFYDNRMGIDMGRETPCHLNLEDLAVSYADAERNKECLEHLKKYFDVNGNETEKAAVLGLAWLMLQRRDNAISKMLCIQEGWTLESLKPVFGILVSGNKITKAWFQGMQTSECIS